GRSRGSRPWPGGPARRAHTTARQGSGPGGATGRRSRSPSGSGGCRGGAASAVEVVVGVPDPHLGAVGGRRVGGPAAGEDLVVEPGRDPVGRAVEQRVVAPGLVGEGELQGHPDG